MITFWRYEPIWEHSWPLPNFKILEIYFRKKRTSFQKLKKIRSLFSKIFNIQFFINQCSHQYFCFENLSQSEKIESDWLKISKQKPSRYVLIFEKCWYCRGKKKTIFILFSLFGLLTNLININSNNLLNTLV